MQGSGNRTVFFLKSKFNFLSSAKTAAMNSFSDTSQHHVRGHRQLPGCAFVIANAGNYNETVLGLGGEERSVDADDHRKEIRFNATITPTGMHVCRVVSLEVLSICKQWN